MSYLKSEISYCLSSEKISNEELSSRFPDASGVEIFKKTGISIRYQTMGEVVASDLGLAAAKKLFRENNIDTSKIDYVIYVSSCLDYKCPTTACIIQHELGLNKGIGAIDILHGCTGYIYGLSSAKGLIATGQAENVLLITADSVTKMVHPDDLELLSIFSDAGAACLISKDQLGLSAEIGSFTFGTDGGGENNIKISRSGMKNPTDAKWFEKHKDVPSGMKWGHLTMNGSQIFIFAIRRIPNLVDEILKKENLSKDDIDLFIFHQANGVMLDFLRSKLKIPKKKFYFNIANKGNTVSASIPIALKDAFDEGLIKRGNKVLLVGFGIGYSWGGTVIKY